MIDAPPRNSRATQTDRGISHILEELKSDLSGVLGGTFALLRLELSENAEEVKKAAKTAIGGAVTFAIGALFLVTSLNLLAIDLLAPELLSAKTAAWVCTFTTGTILLIAGFVFTKRNTKKLSAENMIPTRTLESLENSFEWATDKAEESMQK